MIEMTLAEVASVVGGTVDGPPDVVVRGPAFVDSRTVEPGGLFVAVVGERVDGHSFAEGAAESGAAAVLAARPVGPPAVVVDDTVVALGRLAAHVLRQLTGCTVVGITGSQGKTSTKDLVARVLAQAGSTVATIGNANNEIGLPLTVLRAGPGTRFLVLEMGARGIGHIASLCEIAPPRIGCVLNVGVAHVGEFGSREAIATAKGELVEAATEVAVLNADDPLVLAMQQRATGTVLTFGEAADAAVRFSDLSLGSTGSPTFTLSARQQSVPLTLQVVGEHQAPNAAAAAAIGLAAGMGLDEVAAALVEAVPTSRWRMERHERADGVTVINDAYNANPDSMRAALKTLAMIGSGKPRRRTIAVLGEMRELGDSARDEHDAIGRLAVRLDVSQLVVVGEAARALHLGACLEGSWDGESLLVPDTDAAIEFLESYVRPGDVVLLKASRAVELERVADALLVQGVHTRPGADDDEGEGERIG